MQGIDFPFYFITVKGIVHLAFNIFYRNDRALLIVIRSKKIGYLIAKDVNP
jgi:hypothetical protein